LDVFYQVGLCKGITVAGRKLNVDPSAVSKHIGELEEYFDGRKLFQRWPFEFTEFGKEV
jgi:DNA-binding transcriptional LysR family regulator